MLMDAAPLTLGFVPASLPPSLEDESGEEIVITDVLRRANSRGTVVWRGTRCGVDVAIKMVSSEASGRTEAEVIRALAACEHVPAIVSNVSSNASWYAMSSRTSRRVGLLAVISLCVRPIVRRFAHLCISPLVLSGASQ